MNRTSGIRIRFDDGKNIFYLCSCYSCSGNHWDVAYSYIHAIEMGWKFTKDIQCSKDGKMVAICPACIDKE